MAEVKADKIYFNGEPYVPENKTLERISGDQFLIGYGRNGIAWLTVLSNYSIIGMGAHGGGSGVYNVQIALTDSGKKYFWGDQSLSNVPALAATTTNPRITMSGFSSSSFAITSDDNLNREYIPFDLTIKSPTAQKTWQLIAAPVV